MKQNMKLFITLMLFIGCCFAQHANAAMRIFEFRGTITSSTIGGFPVGTPFLATLSYDDAQLPFGSNSESSFYNSMSFTLVLTGLNYTGNPLAHQLEVRDNPASTFNPYVLDRLNYSGTRQCGIPQVILYLGDHTSSVFNSTSLPSSLTLADFDEAVIAYFTDQCDPDLQEWRGTITSITYIPTTPVIVASSTAISSDNNPSCQSSIINYTATVTANGNPVTTGTVSFTDGPNTLANNVALNSNGQAFLSNNTFSAGDHTITATYNGDENILTSNASLVQTINPLPVFSITPTLSCGTASATINVPGDLPPGPIPVINPDFEILYKAGSTTATAPPLGLFSAVSGLTSSGMTGPAVTFSDGSTGDQYDMAGWEWNISSGANGAFVITNLDPYMGAPRNNIVAINGAGFIGADGAAERTMSQVLSTSLEQGSTYVLTADFGWRPDNLAPTLPPVLRLYAGGTLLTPVSSASPSFVQGDYVTWSQTYSVNDALISGALKIEVGLGDNTDGQQLDFDHITLTKTASAYSYSWNTNPIQTTATATGLTNRTYTATVTAPTGCRISSDILITPYVAPHIIASPVSQTICSGNGITNIALSSDVNGTTYNWTRDNGDLASGIVTGIAASAIGNISGILTNTTAADVMISFTITAVANGCPAIPVTATVLVNGKLTMTAPSVTQPTCAISTGKIVVNATAGSALEYSINGGSTWSSSNTFNTLAPGQYNLVARLANAQSCVIAYSSSVVLVAATNCCTITCPANIIANNKTGLCGAYVNYPAAIKTGSCGTGALTYSQACGSWFPVGNTTVTVSSSTGASCSFIITVKDVQKPVISCPSNISVNAATGACSKVVTYAVNATDNCPGLIVTSVPASGSSFPTGTTTVYVTAKDASNNTTTTSFTVTVKETVKPVINCPANITVNAATGLCSATINPGTATATDNCSVVTVTGTRSDSKALTAAYPVGVTTITWKATDRSGNYVSCQQKITVKDIQPPVTSSVSANPSVLWPADHSMKTVTINYNSTDNCSLDCSGSCVLSVTSNEPTSGTGSGDLPNDWQIINNHSIKLRAERKSNGTGRIYTIKITCTDASGNVGVNTVTVSVPLTSPGSKGNGEVPSFTTTREVAPSFTAIAYTEKLNIQISPNPGSYQFNLAVKTNSREKIQVRILDITGRQVKQTKTIIGNLYHFGEDLLPGTYFAEVRQGNEKQVMKIIKL